MTRNREISNSDDIIDSRDVIARIEELESDRKELTDAIEELTEVAIEDRDEGIDEKLATVCDDLQMWDDINGDELKALKAFADEGENSADDWMHGAALIRESYFEDYARDVASDLYGREIDDAKWPISCIDWKQAASELEQDYSSVDFDGVTYLVR